MKKIDLACIIDDDPIFVFGAKRIMEMAHFCSSFLIFPNGRQALDKLKAILIAGEQLPDIILLDINMPVLDGWGFWKSLLRSNAQKKSSSTSLPHLLTLRTFNGLNPMKT